MFTMIKSYQGAISDTKIEVQDVVAANNTGKSFSCTVP